MYALPAASSENVPRNAPPREPRRRRHLTAVTDADLGFAAVPQQQPPKASHECGAALAGLHAQLLAAVRRHYELLYRWDEAAAAAEGVRGPEASRRAAGRVDALRAEIDASTGVQRGLVEAVRHVGLLAAGPGPGDAPAAADGVSVHLRLEWSGGSALEAPQVYRVLAAPEGFSAVALEGRARFASGTELDLGAGGRVLGTQGRSLASLHQGGDGPSWQIVDVPVPLTRRAVHQRAAIVARFVSPHDRAAGAAAEAERGGLGIDEDIVCGAAAAAAAAPHPGRPAARRGSMQSGNAAAYDEYRSHQRKVSTGQLRRVVGAVRGLERREVTDDGRTVVRDDERRRLREEADGSRAALLKRGTLVHKYHQSASGHALRYLFLSADGARLCWGKTIPGARGFREADARAAELADIVGVRRGAASRVLQARARGLDSDDLCVTVRTADGRSLDLAFLSDADLDLWAVALPF